MESVMWNQPQVCLGVVLMYAHFEVYWKVEKCYTKIKQCKLLQ